MASIKVTHAADRLLVPLAFKREKWGSYLFTPYSRKLGRRVYVYTPLGYDLWVHLESNPDIKTFNERPSEVPLPIARGKAANASPDAISVDHCGIVTVHDLCVAIESDDGEAAERLDGETNLPWVAWAEAQGFLYRRWTTAELRQNPIWLDNIKRLLRWLCRPGWAPSPLMADAVIAELKSRRVTAWNALVRQLGHFEPTSVSAAIAELVLDGRIYSDLHKFSLSQVTELSAHHEFC